MVKKIPLKIIALSLVLVLSLGCRKKKGCTDVNACNFDSSADVDNGSCEYGCKSQSVKFTFAHHYDLSTVTNANFNKIIYTNQFGNRHSITRLRYLISDIALHKTNGDSIAVDGYNLVDVTHGTGLSYIPSKKFDNGDYSAISFNWGFDEVDNISGAYPNLNAANWSWPFMLGGGYHFMQFEGRFIDTAMDTIGFAYHHGKARKITPGDTTFIPNHFRLKLNALNTFSINENTNTTIEIKMNLAEWFRNPNIWNLNEYHAKLMPNYDAQIMMYQNGKTAFEVSVIQ